MPQSLLVELSGMESDVANIVDSESEPFDSGIQPPISTRRQIMIE